MCFLRERERGRLWQSLSSRPLSGMRVLQRIRREFLRTLLLLSLVKAQRETLQAARAWLNEYREAEFTTLATDPLDNSKVWVLLGLAC